MFFGVYIPIQIKLAQQPTIFLYFFYKQKKMLLQKKSSLVFYNFSTRAHSTPIATFNSNSTPILPTHTHTHIYHPGNISITSLLSTTNPPRKPFPSAHPHQRISSTHLLVKYNLYLTLGNPKREVPIAASQVKLQAHTSVSPGQRGLHKQASG